MSTGEAWPEEPWEDSIHELLSSLPPVEPPEGFLQQALDHRPKYAGRLTVGTLATVAGAALLIVGLGLVGDPRSVAPPVGSLSDQHLQVAAGLTTGAADGDDRRFEPVDPQGDVVDLPASFERRMVRHHDDVVQVVYDHDGQPVSVFAQPGRVAWDRLPPEGLGQLDGRTVWVDADAELVIVEVGAYAVTVIGIDISEAVTLLGSEPVKAVTVGDRLRALARDVARQAGFP